MEIMWIFVFHPPRDLPMLCGPFFLSPGAVGMHLHAGAVEAEDLDAPVDQMHLPQRGEQPVEHARLGPAVHPGVNREPIAEVLRQGAPLAAVLRNEEKRVDEDDVRNPHISALDRQIGDGFSRIVLL